MRSDARPGADRRADGHELVLNQFSLARELGNEETVRAEELVFSVPDERSVRTLINSTPILQRTAPLASERLLFVDPSVLKIGHNLKYDMVGPRRYGVVVSPVDDTMLLSSSWTEAAMVTAWMNWPRCTWTAGR